MAPRPRSRALVALALVAVVAASPLAGCSGDDEDAATTTTTTEAASTTDDEGAATTTTAAEDGAVPVDEWAEGFCADVSQWLDELTVIAAATSEPAASPAEAQATLAELFGRAAIYTTQLADRTEGGGAPDVDEGEEVTAALVDRFRVFAASAAGTKEAVEALDVDSPTFAADADALAAGFREQVAQVGASFAEVDAEYGSAELGTAVIEACDF